MEGSANEKEEAAKKFADINHGEVSQDQPVTCVIGQPTQGRFLAVVLARLVTTISVHVT